MRRSFTTDNKLIRFGLGIVTVLIALLCSGCTSSIQKAREDPSKIYRGYDGPKLPKEEVATVWWHWYPYTAVSIDGNPIIIPSRSKMRFLGAELSPGPHTIRVSARAIKSVPVAIDFDVDLSSGNVYRFEYKSRLYATEPVDYAISIIDAETEALVAGRPPEVLKWSWSDWERALQRLKRDLATEKQTIELISKPVRHMCDNIAAYLVSHSKGLIPDWPIYALPPKHGGFLFVEFDESHRLQDYTFVDAPFRDCHRNPFTVWDVERWYSEYDVCWSRLVENACDEFRAVTGKSAE